MKLFKLATVLGLSLLSLQCFASAVYCESASTLPYAAQLLSSDLQYSDNVTAPSIIKDGDRYIICVTSNGNK